MTVTTKVHKVALTKVSTHVFRLGSLKNFTE